MTDGLDAALQAAAAGGSPDTIALMRILGEASSEEEARQALRVALALAAPGSPLHRIQALWAAHPQAWQAVRGALDLARHDQAGEDRDSVLAFWTTTFDKLAVANPEAGVALYSLGSAELLAAATEEIVAFLEALGLLGSDRDGLDLGCGIGRLLVALSPHMRSMRGFDIAPGMVAEARRRCAALRNVTVSTSDGRNLPGLMAASLDLAVAADVFPYLVQAGGEVVAAHLDAFGRALKPGGVAVIFNYSYRGDDAADRADLVRIAGHAGLGLERSGRGALRTWDAAAFILRRR